MLEGGTVIATVAEANPINLSAPAAVSYLAMGNNDTSRVTVSTASTATVYDSGTVWAQAGSFQATVNYGQDDTGRSVATNLASALSASGSPVTANASGSTVSITTTGTGAGANLSLSTGSSTSDGADFSSPSFSGSPSGSSLTGGGIGSYSVTGIAYAPDGDVIADADSVNGQWQYEYGPLNRLTEACSPNCASPSIAAGYAYDRFGNRRTPWPAACPRRS